MGTVPTGSDRSESGMGYLLIFGAPPGRAVRCPTPPRPPIGCTPVPTPPGADCRPFPVPGRHTCACAPGAGRAGRSMTGTCTRYSSRATSRRWSTAPHAGSENAAHWPCSHSGESGQMGGRPVSSWIRRRRCGTPAARAANRARPGLPSVAALGTERPCAGNRRIVKSEAMEARGTGSPLGRTGRPPGHGRPADLPAAFLCGSTRARR